VLLAWATDLVGDGDAWSNARAKRHARSAHVRDAFHLRINGTRFVQPGTIGRRIVSFCCPKRKAGDRYAVPDQGQCSVSRRPVKARMDDVPSLPELHATAARLQGHGVKVL